MVAAALQLKCIEMWSITSKLFQYPIRCLILRSRKASKPLDLYFELSDRSEIWQAVQQHCCRDACQLSKRCDDLNYQSRVFETSRDLTTRRLIECCNRAQVMNDLVASDRQAIVLYIVVDLVHLRCHTDDLMQKTPNFSALITMTS